MRSRTRAGNGKSIPARVFSICGEYLIAVLTPRDASAGCVRFWTGEFSFMEIAGCVDSTGGEDGNTNTVQERTVLLTTHPAPIPQ